MGGLSGCLGSVWVCKVGVWLVVSRVVRGEGVVMWARTVRCDRRGLWILEREGKGLGG